MNTLHTQRGAHSRVTSRVSRLYRNHSLGSASSRRIIGRARRLNARRRNRETRPTHVGVRVSATYTTYIASQLLIRCLAANDRAIFPRATRRRNVASAGLSFGLYRVAPFAAAAFASTRVRTWTLNEFREPPSPPRLPRGFPFSSRDVSRWRACIRTTCTITMLSSPREAPYIPRFTVHRRRSAAPDCPRETTWPDLPENLLLFLVHYRHKSALQRCVEMLSEIVREISISIVELEYSILNLIREERKV